MRVYLIRHGKPAAVWGSDDEDPGLDEAGREQALAMARRLMDLPPEHRPSRVVSSPLRRCRETAEPTAAALGVAVEIEPAVGEIPTPANLDASERPAWLREAFTGTWSAIRGDIDYEAWRRRVAQAVSARPGVAIFSHFVAINAVISVVTASDQVIGFRPDHTAMTTLDVDDGVLTLIEKGGEAVTGVL